MDGHKGKSEWKGVERLLSTKKRRGKGNLNLKRISWRKSLWRSQETGKQMEVV